MAARERPARRYIYTSTHHPSSAIPLPTPVLHIPTRIVHTRGAAFNYGDARACVGERRTSVHLSALVYANTQIRCTRTRGRRVQCSVYTERALNYENICARVLGCVHEDV